MVVVIVVVVEDARDPQILGRPLANLDPLRKHGKAEDDQRMLPDKKDQTRPPKTRFNSRDRSKEAPCVPRLKSFPAEKIKKLDDPPTFSSEPIGVPMVQRDPREVFLASSSVGINCDRGDATSSELSPAHQQFKVNSERRKLVR